MKDSLFDSDPDETRLIKELDKMKAIIDKDK